jgi:putative endonuclease
MLKRLFGGKTTAVESSARTDAQVSGDRAEAHAESHLQSRGFTPVARNYRCRYGEIDLIMNDAATLVFVEVRFRKNGDFGGAIGSIHQRKQQRLIAAANHYLMKLSNPPACRFDVVLIDAVGKIEWIQDAFQS